MKRAFRHILMLGILVAVSAVLGLQIQANLGPLPPEVAVTADQTAPATGTEPEPAITRYTPPAFTSFSETVARPLFRRDRRPPTVVAPAAAPEVKRSLEVTLQGVFFSAAGKVALLSKPGSSEIIRVGEGEEYDGWRLEEITPDSAAFRRGDDQVMLRLKYAGDN